MPEGWEVFGASKVEVLENVEPVDGLAAGSTAIFFFSGVLAAVAGGVVAAAPDCAVVSVPAGFFAASLPDPFGA